MFKHVEMHGDMAAPGVLAENSGSKIPARVTDTRQCLTGMARLERHNRQHGPIIERERRDIGGGRHARVSGGR